jgi:hypothetical protein
MTDDSSKSTPRRSGRAKVRAARELRRAAALRANLARRKHQARGRIPSDSSTEGGSDAGL